MLETANFFAFCIVERDCILVTSLYKTISPQKYLRAEGRGAGATSPSRVTFFFSFGLVVSVLVVRLQNYCRTVKSAHVCRMLL